MINHNLSVTNIIATFGHVILIIHCCSQEYAQITPNCCESTSTMLDQFVFGICILIKPDSANVLSPNSLPAVE